MLAFAHPEHAPAKDGVCGGGLVAREDAGSDSDEGPDVTAAKPASATAPTPHSGGSNGIETPPKARPPVTQVLPPEPRRLSARAHHPCAPWFRHAMGAIEPRPSRRSLSSALAEEPLLFDHADALPNEAAIDHDAPQVSLCARSSARALVTVSQEQVHLIDKASRKGRALAPPCLPACSGHSAATC